MEYINPFLSESVLEKTLSLKPKNGHKLQDPCLEYHRVLTDRGRKPDEAAERKKDSMTLGGMKYRLAIYIVLFISTFSMSWFFVRQHVFNTQLAYVGGSFIVGLILSILNRQNPRLSEFISPICVILLGVTLGGVVQFFDHDIREACLYFIGIPISVSLASFMVISQSVYNSKSKKIFIGATSVVALAGMYCYVLALEFLVHIPLDLPHQLDPTYLAFVVLYLVAASYCVYRDYELAGFSIMNGAKKTMESYLAFCVVATMFFFYLACAQFLIKDE